MDTRTATDKLRHLLPHWIEHNVHHREEFGKWASLARAEGQESLARILEEAASSMAATDEVLTKALTIAGGETGTHGHHHHH